MRALVADPTAVRGAQLILACGDLPFEYLGSLMNALAVPLVFVPGNHDPDVSGYRSSRAGLTLKAGLPARPPWPAGAVNADGRIVDVAGLRPAGLGGSRRYSDGPNQYTDRQQTRRARALRGRAWWRRAAAYQRGRRAADARATAWRRGRRGPPASRVRRAARPGAVEALWVIAKSAVRLGHQRAGRAQRRADLGDDDPRQPSRRAIATALRPAAPPPPTSTAPRGSMPWLSVISSIARTICSVASRRTAARRLVPTSRPSGSRDVARDRRVRPRPRRARIAPPRK